MFNGLPNVSSFPDLDAILRLRVKQDVHVYYKNIQKEKQYSFKKNKKYHKLFYYRSSFCIHWHVNIEFIVSVYLSK